jgi:phosphotransferase system enzyme I (PtsI)
MVKKEKLKEIKLTGIAASPGIAIGPAHIYSEEKYIIPNYKIDSKEVEKEIKRFESALSKTKRELNNLRKEFLKKVKTNELDFFAVHFLILDDPYIEKEVITEIVDNHKNAEWALYEVVNKYLKNLKSLKDEYLSERAADIQDLAKRLMNNLIKKQPKPKLQLENAVVLIARDLTPTDTASMEKEKILGFVTELGGSTSHTAIVARALEIPAVVGIQNVFDFVSENNTIIVDGNHGVIIINPNEKTLKEYKTAKSVFEKFSEELKKIRYLQPVTTDRKYIRIAGNIEINEEVDSVITHGGEGIGLFRTEFLYLNRTELPTENELFNIFKEAVEKMKPYEVIFRTLDAGGDKIGGSIKNFQEANPFLGYRAIRFCFDNIDIFKTQLRAILRASYFGNGKIMFPMISSVDEIRQIKKILNSVKESLRKEGKNFKEDIELGAMIEIPSAAITSDILAKEVSFFSIGTNDLVQYTLAVDRNNPKISYLYEPFHPAIIKLIKQVVENAHKNNVEVHICGELAADPMAAILFIGMDVDVLSMSAINIPEIKKLIRSISYNEANEILNQVLKLETAQNVKELLHKFLKEKAPDLLKE